MMLGEYMRKNHPPPLTYVAPKKASKAIVEFRHISIPVKEFDLARAFVMAAITGAIFLPGKWGILAGVVGNAYWLYKIR